MNKEELIGKLQMVYVGDINALNELIGYYDGLKQGIEELQQERNQFKEYTNHNYDEGKKKQQIIDKAYQILDDIDEYMIPEQWLKLDKAKKILKGDINE